MSRLNAWIFSACSGILSLGPYICIFLVARELVATEGNLLTLADATMARYGWLAVNLTVASFMLYGIGLLCSHWTAFNLAANLRIRLVRRLGELPLGFHTANPSGKLRKIIEKNADNTENFIAHQLPDLAQAHKQSG
ncbi:MAG: ABC transporter transmembrane domain-containing protein, partial [Desulfitobacterium hafniense]